ncbi:MAG: hypothetical protein IJS95_02170 [Prevotella sp.]|nr:hypothetical protein [Prevotella sp.]
MGYHGLDERGLQRARKAERAREQFERAWTRNQVVYWQERIDKLRINDTGALRSSITGMLHPGPTTTIEHSFLQYGLYVSNGTAREFGDGYTDRMGRTYDFHRGGEGTWNAGQLPFLLPGGEAYRKKHHLDRPKKIGPAWKGKRFAGGKPHYGRDWFFRKYAAGRHVLNEMEAAAYGQAYQGMLTQAVDGLFHRTRFL